MSGSLRRLALGLLAAAAAGCSDPVAPGGTRAIVRFTLSHEALQVVSAVRVQLGYRQAAGPNVALADSRFAISANQQSVSVEVDIATCLADADHVGSESECTVDADISVLDAADAVSDRKQVGPFILKGGASTSAPPVTFDVLVATVDVTPASVSVFVGGLVQLNAEPRSVSGASLASRPVTWASSDASIASVDSTGLVTGVAPGTVTITATSEGVAGTATVTVLASSPGGNVLVPGDLRAGTISAAAETDAYTFSGQNGGLVLVTLARTSGFDPNNGVLPRATVVAPGGTQLLQFNANGQRTLELNATGTHTIRVEANNLASTGNYSIGFEQLRPLGPIDANLNPGDVVAGTVSASAEVDMYAFAGQAGDQVLVTLARTSGFDPNNGVVPRVTVTTPAGIQLAQFNANGQRTLALAESGTFIIRVEANNVGSVGNYGIGVERLKPPGPQDGSLVAGAPVAGVITAAAEVDVYTFSGQTGTSVTITLTHTGGFDPNNGVVPRATVIAPGGAQVVQFNATAQRTLNLTETGAYTVLINANNVASTGTYSLSIQ